MRMYIGLDVHKDYLQAAVLDAEGQLVKQQRITNARDDILNFFQPYDKVAGVGGSAVVAYKVPKKFKHLN